MYLVSIYSRDPDGNEESALVARINVVTQGDATELADLAEGWGYDVEAARRQDGRTCSRHHEESTR